MSGILQKIASFCNSKRAILISLMFACVATLTPGVVFADCPFNSVQARVQEDEQHHWTPELIIYLEEDFRVGAFKNGWGVFAGCCVSLEVTGPNEFYDTPENGTYVTPPYIGTYTLTVRCGNLQDKATITVYEKSTPIPLYRYWNSGIGDHFYTTNWSELGSGNYGWGYEGVQCYVYPQQQAGTVPLYRYWNSGGDHFYTTNWSELGSGNYGWGYEGVQCYVYPQQQAGIVPLYRYWNSGIGDHFYTTNWSELGSGNYGWGYEGVQCYVYPCGRCIGAPFTWPTWGKRGWVWRQPVDYLTQDGDYLHDGIDICQVNGQENIEPVHAVCNGLLHPFRDWAFKIECDSIDPSFDVPDRDVWVYYTHMGNHDGTESYILPEFRPGNSPTRVTQGQLLGYQGKKGTGGVHLHISVNTCASESCNIDPSPYFGDELNYDNGARNTGNTPPFNCNLQR